MDLGADDYDQALYGRGIWGAIAARLEKQALRRWFAAQSQSVSESPVVDTLKPAAPKSIFPSLPHLSTSTSSKSIITNRLPYMTWLRQLVTPNTLPNLVGSQTGQTVHWIVERRMTAACSLLLKADQSVEQIAAAVGYLNSSHFFANFASSMG